MSLQTIFQAGNSQTAVVIPKHISDQLGLKKGQKVIVDILPGEETVVLKKVQKVTKSKAKDEFQKWLSVFMKENGEILDELAQR